MPNASSMTLTIGTKQLVVHEAFEITWCRGRVVLAVVDPDDEGGVGVGGRRGDEHPAGPALEVGGGVVPRSEAPGGLDDHVDAQLAPRQRLGVALGEHPDALAVDDQVAAVGVDLAVEAAVGGVVAQEVGVGGRRR